MWGVGGGPGSALCPDSSAVHTRVSAAPSGSWGEVRRGESGSMLLSSRAAGRGGPATGAECTPGPFWATLTTLQSLLLMTPPRWDHLHSSSSTSVQESRTEEGLAWLSPEVRVPGCMRGSPPPRSPHPASKDGPRAVRFPELGTPGPRVHQAQQAGWQACRRPALVGAGGPPLSLSLLGGRPWSSRHHPAQAQGPRHCPLLLAQGLRAGPPQDG